MSFSGKLIVFTAPSGSGKTTIVRHILNTLDESQVLDLLAYLLSDGESTHAAFSSGATAIPKTK